jgi:peptidyl-prolyl cis-trans isomerase D
MLEYFRNAAKSWFAKGLLGLLAVAFGVWGITDVFKGGGVKDLATVGSRTITGADYSTALSRTQQRLQQQNGVAVTLDDIRKQGIDVQIRDNLISTAAVDDLASRLKIFYSAKTVAQDAANNPAFHDSNGKFDPIGFRRILEQNGTSEEGYVQGEIDNHVRTAVTSTGRITVIPKTFTDAMHRFIDETRDVRYFTFQINEQNAPQPSDADLKKQYESTPAAYTAPEYRSIAIVTADPANSAAKYEVSAEELKNGFEKFKAEYSTPEKRTYIQVAFPTLDDAKKAKARVDAGTDLMKIAEEMKLKPADITFTDRTRGDLLDEKIAAATFDLALNAVSAPVEGALATALVKVTAITKATEPTLDGIKAEITTRLQNAKAAEDIQSVFDTVEEMRSNQSKYEEIAAKLNLPITIVKAVSATGLDPDGKPVTLAGGGDLLKAIYEGDVGVEADPLTVGQGYVWYDVREVIPSALKPLDKVKDQVKADWIAAHIRTLAADKAKELIARGEKGAKLEDLAKEMNGTIKTVAGVHRNQSTPEMDGLASIAVFGVAEKGFATALEADGKTARLMQVDKITLKPFDDKSEQSKQMAEQSKQAISNDLVQTYLASARAAAKVTINDELWAKIAGSDAGQ